MKSIFDFKAAIFDLDGTLANSMHVWDRVCQDWLLEHNRTPSDTLERELAAMTMTQSAEYVAARFGVDMPPDIIISDWQRAAIREYESTVTLKDGVKELLQELYARGVKLAVATSSFPAACESVLRRYAVREYFSALVYSDEVKRNKSFPDIWLSCAERLQVAPAECVAFDDLPEAVKGAKAAGMSFVAVYDSFCEDWQALKAKADLAVVSMRELCRFNA